ncbi:molybdopterin-synthase adenylyltransferase MoeB [Bacterioplanes sanyensis]|uniref:Molybdopterin-synthase adenylyltransferase n=1 Tax=Bacterioplanes sanyensis TaxID=1249553 RepID=A0A222FEM3_9GAMM|nr:molybdopterin-synthase adenylyltransferase MoeB [Bacterioplanes sanyensis]ASP37189.1 molybdopterin-synthase adenylyltransferase MoeB [Bacterioplanes sanyensis]
MNDQQLLRYARHVLLPQVDVEGQQQLLDAHVLIVGLGGLGCPVAQYLAASGVGRLTLVDPDRVELSNLQRQIAHSDATLGEYKVHSAAKELARINSGVQVYCCPVAVDVDWLQQQLESVDVVVDCSDNADVRYAINAACLQHKTPWVSGAAVALQGQLAVFDPRIDDSPCYRCLYPNLSDAAASCAGSGVIAPLVGVIGSMQALETLKLLLGLASPLGQLLSYDALQADWRRWQLNQQKNCADCGSLD